MTSGSVTIDGINIKDMNVKHLRSQIGFVQQEPVLFATTIANNIAFGCPDVTRAQMEEAAKQANAHDFILSFPDGYDTQVGDKGTQISGGKFLLFAKCIIYEEDLSPHYLFFNIMQQQYSHLFTT